MGDENVFTKSQLNYFRVCHLAANVLPRVLRNIFVAQWNQKFFAKHGKWENEVKNGQDFLSMESERNKKRNKDILDIMADGDSNQWDCTKHFYALLYSTSVGDTLDHNVRKHVNDLREFRNESFAHVSLGEVSSSDFQKIVNKVLQAFLGLGQDTLEVKKIQSQKSFSTEEIYELQETLEQERSSQEQLDKRVSNLEERVAFLETNTGDQFAPRPTPNGNLNNEISNTGGTSPFIVLPARPIHQVIQRESVEVARDTLSELKTIHANNITAIYIAGGPASGKTECARQLGRAVSEQISFIMTLDARNYEYFVISLKELAVRLGFSDESLTYLKQQSDTSQVEFLSLFIKEKLATIPAWLLILDGLTEEIRLAQRYLPQIGDEGNGQIVITTQDGAVVADNSYTACIFLNNGLTSNESLQLLFAIAGPITQETARTVSEKLGYQPMFLVSSANHVKKLSTNSGATVDLLWKEFLESLTSRHKEEQLPYYLAAINQATQSNLEAVIEDILKRCQVKEEFFHLLVLANGAALPLSFLLRMLSYQLGLSECEIERRLRNCLLLVFSVKGAFEFIKVNGVVYKLIYDILAPSVMKEPMLERLRCLGHFALKNMHDSMVCGVFKIFTPEILRYLSLLEFGFPDYPEQRNLHHQLGQAFLYVLVDYSSAVRCFTKAMLIYENAKDIGHREYAILMSSLGNVFRLTGNTDEACRYLNKSLKLLKSLCTSLLDEDIANCLSSLGLVHQSLGDLDRAIRLHDRALTIRQEIHGEDNISTATSLNNIGGVHHEKGDLAMAKKYYWDALAIKGRNYGWDFPHVANSFNNIAEISHEQGDLCGALAIHKRALKIRQRLHGEDHPDIANSLNNIAVIYHKLAELSSARKYHVKAVEIRKRIYGEDHAEVASSLSNLGQVYYDEGDLAAAEQCHTQALRIRQSHSTAASPVVSSLHNLMRVYLADHEIATAKAYAYEVFKIFQQTHGMNDSRTIHAFRKMTEISKRESQGQAFEIPFNTFEHVERLSCL